ETGEAIKRFGTRYTSALASAPDGTVLASGHWDNVTLWDMLTGERIGLLPGFGRYVDGIAFSKDGNLLAAGTDTGDLQIWDVQKRKRLQVLNLGGTQVSN